MNRKTGLRQSRSHARRASAAMALLVVFGAQTALANPLGPTVVSGQASFAASGNTLTVTNTPNTIINWQGFSIGANEATRFVQQDATSAVLNRVIGSNPSSILGTLQSNGRVFLVNPSGIVFGKGATVDVAGLVASSLNLSNADFLAGRYNFADTPGAQSISNAGNIAAQSGGQIYLIAPDIENTGIITAPNGEILLAAGHSVELVDSANPNLRVNITAPAGDATNVGQLIAASGSLGLFGTVVRNSGTASADSATTQGGKIVFKASQRAEISGTVSANSTATASAPPFEKGGLGGIGGTIQVLGNEVGVTGSLDASGANGGGTVLVGGDYQGKNPEVQNATVTYFGADASINADATQNGDGGKVIVWADDTTRAYGSISARGGQQGGDGGLVETSGKRSLDTSAKVDTSAPSGKVGTWLLDPSEITITSTGTGTLTGGIFDPAGASGTISWSTIETGLADGNVTVQTSSGTVGAGYIMADDGYAFTNAGGGALTLNANGDIMLNSSGTPISGNPQGLTLQAGGHVVINNSISLNGNINITASTGNISINKSVQTTGDIVASAGGGILPASLDSGATYGQFMGNLVSLTATNGMIGSNVYGFATEVIAQSLNLSAANGIGTSGKMFAADVIGTISFSNTNNAVDIYNGSFGMSRLFTGNNANGPVRLESSDTNYPTTIGNLSSGGDTIIRMNNLTITGPITSPGANTVYLSPYTNSPAVPAVSINGADTFNLTGGGLSQISAGKIVIGNDSFGNITPTVNIGTASPVSVTNAAKLEIWGDAINVGASGVSNTGGGVGLLGDSMAIGGTVSSDMVFLRGKTASQTIDLGTDTAGTLGLTAAEMGLVSAATALYIGDTLANGYTGSIHASNAVTFTAPAVILQTGGGITQTATGTITATNLAIRANGDVVLDTAFNSVTNLAANVTGSASNFSFMDVDALNIGVGIDGLSGISMPGFVTGGVIALTSGGALTQSPGAFLAGSSVYAEGSKVILTEANPTGVIAGQSTGSGTGDIFSYTSSNGIMVTTVDGFSGIQTGAPDAASVVLSAGSAGIFQDAVGGISTGVGAGGLSLSTTGPVGLVESNNVGALTASGASQLSFNNAAALTVGIGGNGVTTANGAISINSSGDLTVQGPVNAGSGAVYLAGNSLYLGSAAPVAGGFVDLTATLGSTGTVWQYAGGTVSSSSDLFIVADNIFFGGSMISGTAPSGGVVSISPSTSARSIEIAGAVASPTAGTLSITQTDLNAINPAASALTGGGIGFGDASSGAITFKGNYTSPGGMYTYLNGASVSQDAGTVVSGGLRVEAGGAVLLNNTGNQITSLGGVFTSPSSIDVVTNVPSVDLWGTVSAGVYLNVKNAGGNILVDSTTAAPTIMLDAANGITLGTASSLVASGPATIILNTGTGGFYNNSNAGASVLVTPRWLVYADNPGIVFKGGLTSDFRHYGATYANYSAPTETGNGFIYASTPGVLSVDTTLLSGTASHIYGATPTAVFGYAFANPTIADSEDLALITGTPAYTPTIDSLTPTGAYNVSYASGISSAAGYTFASGTGLGYTVDPATLTVITAALTGTTSKTYDGTTAATLTPGNFLLSGFVNGDDATVTQTVGSYASKNAGSGILVTATLSPGHFSPVGSTQLSNYTLPASASGNIGGITPAPLTVTASDFTKVYDAIPYSGGNGVIYSGLVNGETAAVLGGALVYGGTSQGAVDAGSYTITPGGLTSGNYAISYVDGQLAITQLLPPPPPTMGECTADPTLTGCTAVLPTLTDCTTNPALAGCTAVLPPLTDCTTNPTLPGCTAVLPPLADCTTNPTLAGCTAVLPTLADCTANPSLAGCTAVLPPLTDCTTNPTLPGCTAVLPPMADCTTNPTLPGCTAVLPPVGSCVIDPTLPGCTAVLPPATVVRNTVETVVVAMTTNIAMTFGVPQPPPLLQPAEAPAADSAGNAASAQSGDAGSNGEKDEDEKDKKDALIVPVASTQGSGSAAAAPMPVCK